MDIPKESIEYLVGLGKGLDPLAMVDETPDAKTVLIREGGDGPYLKTFSRPAPDRTIRLMTLDAMAEFLKEESAIQKHQGPGHIMVYVSQQNGVVADLSPGTNRCDRVYMKLRHSDEMKGLLEIVSFFGAEQLVSQRDLWRHLITDLYDAIPPELLVAIHGMRVCASRSTSSEINILGLEQSNESSSVVVTFEGPGSEAREANIPLEWVWNGKIWDGFENTYEIPLRLELTQGDRGLGFRFYPRLYEPTIIRALRDMVGVLRAHNIPGVSVFDGAI